MLQYFLVRKSHETGIVEFVGQETGLSRYFL